MGMRYTALSGAEIVKKIRSKNVGRLLLYVLGLLLAVGIVFFGISQLLGGHYFFGIAGLVVGPIVLWMVAELMSKAVATLKNVKECRLFRKYGSPDELAERIAEGSMQPLLESKQALITDSFIMKYGDFESFVPFSDVLLLYRKEHRTNGVLDGIYLVVHDSYGDSFDYPFKLGKKHTEDMNIAANEIAKSAPNCRFGYTKENLEYVKQNARKI